MLLLVIVGVYEGVCVCVCVCWGCVVFVFVCVCECVCVCVCVCKRWGEYVCCLFNVTQKMRSSKFTFFCIHVRVPFLTENKDPGFDIAQ